MDTTDVRFEITLSRREVAALCGALVDVQLNPEGLSEVGRIQLDGEPLLTDTEIEQLLQRLRTAASVKVLTSLVDLQD